MEQIKQLFRWAGSFYTGLFRFVVTAVAGAAAVGTLAFLVAWPLWYVSREHPRLYSAAIVLLFLGGMLLLGLRKLATLEKQEVAALFKKGILLLLFLILLASSIALFSTGRIIIGLVLIVPLSVVGGIIFTGRG